MADAIFIREERRARKTHACSGCNSIINTGATYLYVKGVKGKNGFYLNYFCDNCYKREDAKTQ